MTKQTNYLGNPNLKKTNVKIDFTPEQLQEYTKCSEDPIYFIKHYVKIVTLDEGLSPFNMYDWQTKMIDICHTNRFTICKVPRQSGKTTAIVGYILWYVLFQAEQSIAILANKGDLAQSILYKLQLAYEYLPLWMQQGIISWNKKSIELENKSKIIAASTSSSGVRGGSYNLVFLDEFAFVPFNLAEAFWRSTYPTITAGKNTKVMIVSTPNGMNMFYKMWMESTQKRSSYIPIEVRWNDIPGRDEKFKEETIKNTSVDQWRQEFECEFLGSANTLISPSKLAVLAHELPMHEKDGLALYQKPENNRYYFMVADTSRGIGSDYHAFLVYDVTTIPYKVVARYRNNELSPLLYPNIIKKVAETYNSAFVLIEINDNGQQIADILTQELEYENVITSASKGRAGQVMGSGFASRIQTGVRTTGQVKRIGCLTLKSLIEDDKLLVTDFDSINELSTFVQRKSSFEAEEGQNDDLAMCMVLFSWATTQPYFRDLTDTDVRKKLEDERLKAIEEDMLPVGFLPTDNMEDKFVDDEGVVWSVDDSWLAKA